MLNTLEIFEVSIIKYKNHIVWLLLWLQTFREYGFRVGFNSLSQFIWNLFLEFAVIHFTLLISMLFSNTPQKYICYNGKLDCLRLLWCRCIEMFSGLIIVSFDCNIVIFSPKNSARFKCQTKSFLFVKFSRFLIRRAKNLNWSKYSSFWFSF